MFNTQKENREVLLSLIVPTYNERDNISILVQEIDRCLSIYNYELIIVDDQSPDGTGRVAERLSERYPIRVIHRQNERGLASAVVEGFKHAKGSVLGVLDADLQHPPKEIPKLLTQIEKGADIAICSRYLSGGSVKGWTVKRRVISKVAGLLAKLALSSARKTSDPLSGFFLLRRKVIDKAKLNPQGYKILLEILTMGTYTNVAEVPYTFGERRVGQSKLSTQQELSYLKHLWSLTWREKEITRLFKFSLVGGSGAIVHFAILYSLTDFIGVFYVLSAIIAVIAASTNNYILNHIWTFRDRRETVKNHFIGWLKYNSTSFVTDTMYIGLLVFFVEVIGLWYILGAFFSLCVITPIRFMVVSFWIWGKEKPTKISPDYDWEAFRSWNPLQRYWKRKIAEKVWTMAGNFPQDILDIGCGSSPIITHFPTAIGIDMDNDKLDFMRTKIGNELVCMDAHQLKFPNNSFDLILCIETLEHLDDTNVAMNEISRVLKSGGRAIIATPDNSKILWRIIQFLYDKLMLGGYKEKHKSPLTKDLLIQLANKHNLELIRCEYVARCDMVALFRKVI